MRVLGIRELKARLSEVLRDVQKGDVVLITDRGRVVAQLHRPDASQWSEEPQARALARLAAGGQLRVADRSRPAYQRSPVASREGLARQLLDEDRGEP